jgi:predicted nucleic acid-binding Zn ribbon protein
MSTFRSLKLPKKGPPRPSAGERVLNEWRGADLRAAEADQRSKPKAASSVLPAVLQRLGLERRRAETEILKVWNHLIEPTVVAHAQPTGLRNGTLFVVVDNSVWLDEIVRYRRREILKRLQYSFGPDLIARIQFRVG